MTFLRLKTNSKLRAFKWTVAIILFLAYSIISVNKSWNDDFRAYYQAGTFILSKVDIYDNNVVEGRFLYSPLFALLMVPLSFLPQLLAATVWYLVNVASLLLSIMIALYLNTGSAATLSDWIRTRLNFSNIDRTLKLIIFFVFILSARFWINNIEHGQVNLLLWCLVLVAVYFIKSNRVVIATAFLSLSILIKILPLLVVFYYFSRKRYDVVALSFAWVVVLTIVPAAILGWQHNTDLLTAWYHKILEPNFAVGAIGVGDSNQSFPAMLIRFMSDTPANEETGASVNLLSLPTQVISLISKLSTLAFVGVIGVFPFFQKKNAIERENVELSIVFLTGALVPTLAWKAYFVSAIIGYTTIVYYIIKTQDSYLRRTLIALIAISFALHTLTSDGIWGWRIAHIFQSYSCVTLSILFLYTALLVTLLKQRTQTMTINQSRTSYVP